MGRVFGIDPVLVLDADRDTWRIRFAAAVAARKQMIQEAGGNG